MNHYKVKYATQALNDLRGIYSYIYYDLSSPINAKNQTDRIRKAVRGLDVFPKSHPIVDIEPWHNMGMHQLSVDHYIVFYFVDNETLTVDISRIFYGGRDLQAIVQGTL